MTIPHGFPSLVDGTTQVVLVAGAGLSCGYLPIRNELKSNLDKAANKLGIVGDDFYELAEVVLESLAKSGKPVADSRLWLAEELGLFNDRRWFGETGLPLSGNTPRHRAIARFAVEKRLRAIVSLNWDTLLEAALISVGLDDGVRIPRPWEITAHASVVEDEHMRHLGEAHVFPFIKPHGCVRNLEQARRLSRFTGTTPPVIFKITQSDIDNLPVEQTLVDKRVEVYLSECPLIAIGWEANEGYLRNTVIKIAKVAQREEFDAFTLVDIKWHPNHSDIALAYGKNNNEVFAEVQSMAMPTTDCLFQWLQAKYAINKLIASSPTNQAALQLLLQQLDQPVHAHFILRWVDGWLHTWVRLCWRAGVMQGNDPHIGQEIEPWDIPVIPRDVHVPLGTMTGARRELKAAAKLLAVLGNDLARFNFEKFPGGLWHAETWCLYIPLPGWRGAAQSGDLAALMPLVEALRGLGFVRYIYLVWLDTENAPPDQIYRNQLAAQVRRLMPLEKFARSDALTWIDLEGLKGGTHGLAA